MSVRKDPVEEQAIAWLVLLRSGDCSRADADAFERWRRADSRHDAVCRRLESVLGAVAATGRHGLDTAQVRKLIDVPSTARRRFIGGALALGGLWLGQRLLSESGIEPRQWLADFRTGVAERRSFVLDDGSTITLNACSAATREDGDPRRLWLYEGKLLAATLPDPVRSFSIATAHGRVSAQEGRVQVDARPGFTVVTVLEAQVAVEAAGASLALAAGQSVRFDARGAGQPFAASGAETAWQDGWLEVRDQPLSEVAEALRPYRRGFLSLDPDAAALRVSGRFPLDDPDRALDALAGTLPVRVSRRGPFWVVVSAA